MFAKGVSCCCDVVNGAIALASWWEGCGDSTVRLRGCSCHWIWYGWLWYIYVTEVRSLYSNTRAANRLLSQLQFKAFRKTTILAYFGTNFDKFYWENDFICLFYCCIYFKVILIAGDFHITETIVMKIQQILPLTAHVSSIWSKYAI